MKLRPVILALALSLGSLASARAEPVTCRSVEQEGKDYAVCTVDVTAADLRMFLDAPDSSRLSHFVAVDRLLAESGQRLAFAMNAGMYHADRSPVGLYVEDGVERMRLITSAGPGNFGLLPNGVLCLSPGRAEVIETRTFADRAPDCRHATQSGPMLVIDGALHPRFLPDSTSRYIRNGVGTSADGRTAHFAISNSAVTFHEFARLFRDILGVPHALYFDGSISRLHAPGMGRSDPGFRMGPIIGVVQTPQ